MVAFAMIYAKCRVKHDPENGKYGDCLRACVASIFNLKTEDVPHFCGNGETPEQTADNLERWLNDEQNCSRFVVNFDGSQNIEAVMKTMMFTNPNVNYLLFGSIDGTGHVVVCCNDKIVNDPQWIETRLNGPTESGFWSVMVFIPLMMVKHD